jgi:hypothetical protein
VTPPGYLQRYFLEHEAETYQVRVTLDGVLVLGVPR